MIETDDAPENIDMSQWIRWTDNDPMIKPERAQHGDVIIPIECEECSGRGKDEYTKQNCRKCYGKGRYGERNAIDVAAGDIRFAQIQVRNILNYLWNSEFITDENHDDGHTFNAWRDQHRVAMGQQKAISGETTSTTSTKLRAYGYVLIVKRLSVYDYNAVSKSIETFDSTFTRIMAERERKIYARAFAALTTAFKPIREQVAYLEGLTDEARDELSEGRLKSFLDRIHKNA